MRILILLVLCVSLSGCNTAMPKANVKSSPVDQPAQAGIAPDFCNPDYIPDSADELQPKACQPVVDCDETVFLEPEVSRCPMKE